jgi:hypothetical protein
MVRPTSHPHCVFIQITQSRGGFACVQDNRPCSLQRIHELAGQTGDARHAAEKIQGGPFTDQETPARTVHLRQQHTRLHPAAILHQKIALQFFIKQVKP